MNNSIIVCVLFLKIFIYKVHANVEDNAWIDPHSWDHLKNYKISLAEQQDFSADCSKCAATVEKVSNNEIGVALAYFKKFVITLFNRQKLQYDEINRIYKRSLYFTILPSQLDVLEKSDDPRDLDNVLTQILEKAYTPRHHSDGNNDYNYFTNGFAIILDIIRYFLILLKTSEVQFFLIIILAIGLCWFIHVHYKIHIIVVLLCGIVTFGYFCEYLECNRKLEGEELLKVISNQSKDRENVPWYSRWTFYIFYDNSLSTSEVDNRKSGMLNLNFCRPDHVFIMYLNGLFLKQLESLLSKCTETISSLTNNLGFPFNYIAPILLVFIVSYILKLTFKYILSPKAWTALLQKPSYVTQPTETIAEHSQQDRISGENLKILFNIIHCNKNSISPTKQLPAVSGVQEVFEQLLDADLMCESNDTLISQGSNNNDSGKCSSSSENNSAEMDNLNAST